MTIKLAPNQNHEMTIAADENIGDFQLVCRTIRPLLLREAAATQPASAVIAMSTIISLREVIRYREFHGSVRARSFRDDWT